jgi:hypothetical protein
MILDGIMLSVVILSVVYVKSRGAFHVGKNETRATLV